MKPSTFSFVFADSGLISIIVCLSLFVNETVQPAIPMLETDEMLLAYFMETTSSSTRTVSLYKNGSAHYSYLQTPLVIKHNSLTGLNVGDFKHLTNAKFQDVNNLDFPNVVVDASYVHTDNNFTTAYKGEIDTNTLKVGVTNEPKSDPTGVTGADAIVNIISLTQAEYNAITPVTGTQYIITDASAVGGATQLDELTAEQAAYLGIPQNGPFKSDLYRY